MWEAGTEFSFDGEVTGSSCDWAGENMNMMAFPYKLLAALKYDGSENENYGKVGSVLEKKVLGLFYSGIKEQKESNL